MEMKFYVIERGCSEFWGIWLCCRILRETAISQAMSVQPTSTNYISLATYWSLVFNKSYFISIGVLSFTELDKPETLQTAQNYVVHQELCGSNNQTQHTSTGTNLKIFYSNEQDYKDCTREPSIASSSHQLSLSHL